jgi:hypothetical protein
MLGDHRSALDQVNLAEPLTQFPRLEAESNSPLPRNQAGISFPD